MLPFETNGSANHHELVFSKSSARPQALAGPVPGSLVLCGSVLSGSGVWPGLQLQRLRAPATAPHRRSARPGAQASLQRWVWVPGGLGVLPGEASSGSRAPPLPVFPEPAGSTAGGTAFLAARASGRAQAACDPGQAPALPHLFPQPPSGTHLPSPGTQEPASTPTLTPTPASTFPPPVPELPERRLRNLRGPGPHSRHRG